MTFITCMTIIVVSLHMWLARWSGVVGLATQQHMYRVNALHTSGETGCLCGLK